MITKIQSCEQGINFIDNQLNIYKNLDKKKGCQKKNL